jgi:chromosome segregation ATPase
MPPEDGAAALAIPAFPPPLPVDGSKHTRFAPLSANQTLEMIGDNKGDCISLHKGLRDLQRELAQVLEAVAGLQMKDKKMVAAISVLQDGLANNDKSVDELKKEMDRHDVRVKINRQNIEKVDVKVDQLFDSEKQRDHKIESLVRDSVEMREVIQVLKEDLRRNFESDKSDRGEVVELTGRVFRNLDKMRQGFDDLQDKQRELEAGATKTADDMNRTGSNIDSLVVKLGDACNRLRTAEKTLDENIHNSKRLFDDHDRTKAKVDEVRFAARDLNRNREDLENRFKKALFDLQNTKDKLLGAQETLHAHNDRLNCAQDTATSASQGNLGTITHMHALQHQLEDTTQLASLVKDGLRQTNSVLLPNILLDTEHVGVLKSRDIHQDWRPAVAAGTGGGVSRSRVTTPRSARTLRPQPLVADGHADPFM